MYRLSGSIECKMRVFLKFLDFIENIIRIFWMIEWPNAVCYIKELLRNFPVLSLDFVVSYKNVLVVVLSLLFLLQMNVNLSTEQWRCFNQNSFYYQFITRDYEFCKKLQFTPALGLFPEPSYLPKLKSLCVLPMYVNFKSYMKDHVKRFMKREFEITTSAATNKITLRVVLIFRLKVLNNFHHSRFPCDWELS